MTRAPRRRSPLADLRIVLVDDCDDARDLATHTLRCHGAEVIEVGDAASAFEAVLATAPHVLVSDIAMPHEDGHSLMRRIRLLPCELGLTPAIALTAFVEPGDRWRALDAGFDVHLSKAVTMDVLVRIIRRLVQQRSSGIHMALTAAALCAASSAPPRAPSAEGEPDPGVTVRVLRPWRAV